MLILSICFWLLVMSKKAVFLIVYGLVLIYPLFMLFRLDQALSAGTDLERVQEKLLGFQIGIWISWIFLVSLAIYYKWTKKRNFIFSLTYGFLFVCFSIFGTYTQMMANQFHLPSSFEDDYTLGVFTAVQNIVVSAVLTGFLQAGVWWFTRKR